MSTSTPPSSLAERLRAARLQERAKGDAVGAEDLLRPALECLDLMV